MKKEKISEAMGNISSRHIEEAAEYKAEEKPHQSKMPWIKWVSIAACFCLVAMVGIFTIPNLIGYNSGLSEDEIFDRSNTFFDNYEDLAAIIGNDTLLENVDFASLNDYNFRLTHELDNVNDYHTVSFAILMPEDRFGVGICFPPYDGKIPNYTANGETITINGVTVQYYKSLPEDSGYKYDICAEFEYNGCCYQIRSTGNSDESVFWDNLNALLGN